MTRVLTGAFIASLLLIGSYVYGPGLLVRLLGRGDNNGTDVCKQPTYRQMGKAT